MGLVTQDQVDETKSAVDESVAKAVEFANDSPEPDLSEIDTDVLA
jgi:TPP-dependent pyruvate/acetoin dehydrogenase alpha subunit